MLNEFLVLAALFILVLTTAGLFVVMRTRFGFERLMAIQLLGTGGTAVLLLLGTAKDDTSMVDAALLMVLFAAFSTVAFSSPSVSRTRRGSPQGDQPE